MSRTGILGTKLGMTQIFDEDGRVVPVTVVQAGPCTVTQVKTVETDGYNALQLAFGTRKPKNLTKPVRGHLEKAGIGTARVLAEVRTDDAAEYALGDTITADVFSAGEFVDVTGRSKGKGFAGVMKRHGFAGMGDGHGVKKKNRHPGAIGACATPSRVFPGMRMAGRMGGERVTIQNLEVAAVDAERGLLLIKGAVPGSNGTVVLVRSAVKAPATSTAGGEG
jgi:large subunit ribosomal protein L3